MGLLHPALMWLGVAGSIPIIIHLFNRQRYKRIRWAAMEWLLAAMKKTRRRMQIENLILLAIRVLVLVLLASALARPFMKSAMAAPFAESNTHVVVVMDVSYSMDYRGASRDSTPLEKARQVALGILNDLKTTEADRFSLILLTDTPNAAIGEPSSRVDLGRQIVGDAVATDQGTSIPRTMELVRDALKKSTNFTKKVFLITDNQRHAWSVPEKERTRVAELFKEISELTTPNGGGIILHDVGGNVVDNVAVVDLAPAPGTKVISTDRSVEFVAVLRNYGPMQVSGATMNVFIDGSKQGSFQVTVPAHDKVTQEFHHTFREDGPHAIAVELDADALSHDNRRSLAVDVREALKVLVVNGQKGTTFQTDEVAALKAALNPSIDQRERVDIYSINEVLENGFAREDVRKYDLVVLANLETISQEEVAAIEEFVKAGGGVMVLLGAKVEAFTWNQAAWRSGEGFLPCELDKPAGFAGNTDVTRMTGIDYTHPALEFFAKTPTLKPSLTKLLVSQWFAVKVGDPRPEVRILASLHVAGAEPAPLFIERRMGRGRVLLCTTAADYEWGLMPKVPGYVMLFDQLAQYLAAPPQRFRNITVGEPIEYTLKLNEYAKSFTVITPRQNRSSVAPQRAGEHAFYLSFAGTTDSGLYSLERDPQEGETQPTLLTWYAVNVDPEEGFVEKMTEPELRSMYPQFKFTYVEQGTGKEIQQIAVKAPASNVWKYLVGAILGLLVLETWLAQMFGAKR
ncbi:MAG: BatA domain-containing protein [Planctomycetes bacterium]|nr:BatA domain-containing protein [Planctomycetota bacterium]